MVDELYVRAGAPELFGSSEQGTDLMHTLDGLVDSAIIEGTEKINITKQNQNILDWLCQNIDAKYGSLHLNKTKSGGILPEEFAYIKFRMDYEYLQSGCNVPEDIKVFDYKIDADSSNLEVKIIETNPEEKSVSEYKAVVDLVPSHAKEPIGRLVLYIDSNSEDKRRLIENVCKVWDTKIKQDITLLETAESISGHYQEKGVLEPVEDTQEKEDPMFVQSPQTQATNKDQGKGRIYLPGSQIERMYKGLDDYVTNLAKFAETKLGLTNINSLDSGYEIIERNLVRDIARLACSMGKSIKLTDTEIKALGIVGLYSLLPDKATSLYKKELNLLRICKGLEDVWFTGRDPHFSIGQGGWKVRGTDKILTKDPSGQKEGCFEIVGTMKKIIQNVDFDPDTSLHADKLANILEASTIYSTFIHDTHYMVHNHPESSHSHTPQEGIKFLKELGYDNKAGVISSLVFPKR